MTTEKPVNRTFGKATFCRGCAALVVVSAFFGMPAAGQSEPHPLDNLTASEIEVAVSALQAAGVAKEGARFSLLTVLEPPKQQVVDGGSRGRWPRRALAVVQNGPETVRAVVNLQSVEVEDLSVPKGEAPIRHDEWQLANRLLRSDARWRSAMRERGYEEVESIYCAALSAGYFGEASLERRFVKLTCYDAAGATTNLYSRPIEGLLATVDLNEGVVVEVIDTGVIPVGTRIFNLEDESPMSEIVEVIEAVPRAVGPASSFRRGSLIEWDNWSFHLRSDPRLGPVLSLVSFLDGQQRRSVLYQAHLSELFVPYMSDDPAWYFRSYMDVGEYGFGSASKLERGVDCPLDAEFFRITLADTLGQAYDLEDALCIFERRTAMPAWRHREVLTGQYAGQAGAELVVRSIPTVGNYDYVIDWIFAPSGEIRIEIGATGIMAVKGVVVRNASSEVDPSDGSLVAPGLVAVNHDHFFSFRFDFDLDGTGNSFVVDELTPEPTEGLTPRQSLWRIRSEVIDSEGVFNRSGAPTRWRVINPSLRTDLGYNPGYEIAPGTTAISLLSENDWPQRRAAFSGNTLWVTLQHPGETFAAGFHPNQSREDLGLTAYNNAEAIKNSDLVVWYTMGFHHVTRPEDWPVVPTMSRSVTLRPVAFFNNNPVTPDGQATLPLDSLGQE